jgi:hypothetical protein
LTKVQRLTKELLTSTRFRHHKMKLIATYHESNRIVKVYDCQACGKSAVVNTRPMPNDIEIGGEAVAVNCDN